MNYIKKGSGKDLILLHGWGCNLHVFDELSDYFSKYFTVWSIDLPGFGESKIDEELTIEEYSYLLEDFFLEHEIESPIILGHSFGGRVAIKYASTNYCHKLILVSSAGIKRFNPKVYSYKVKKTFYKALRMNKKVEKLRNKYASNDYKNANQVLRETLKLAVNHDQRKDLSKITCETLLIWGEKDKDTPIKDGILMKRLIKDSELIKIEDAGHYSFLEKKHDFKLILFSFLKGELL